MDTQPSAPSALKPNELLVGCGTAMQQLMQSRKQRIRRDREALARAFPCCFTTPGASEPKLALKINIHFDLLRIGVPGLDGQPLSATRIREALRDYCHGPKYRKALSPGAPRVNLDGDVVGSVGVGEVPPYSKPIDGVK